MYLLNLLITMGRKNPKIPETAGGRTPETMLKEVL